ncbi:MAG: hypothetical protein P4L55_22200 [Syntrophobacteraceae bacterium]|nr:hypothetical protein [Syntrophobacteraceae bacterium]
MDKKSSNSTVPPIRCFVNTGSRPVPLDSGPEGAATGRQMLPGETGMTYGQYLGLVAGLLSQNSFQIPGELLKKQPKPWPKLEASSSLELIAEKHGALYSVSRLRVRFGDDILQFAVNCAFSPQQQAFLQVEVDLLSELGARFDLPYIPTPFIAAQSPGLMLFIAQWFENHHEFHLSAAGSGAPAIKIWNDTGERKVIESPKILELYAQAAQILTSYLDIDTFSQIYPWHHAAGDFIIDDTQTPTSLRLITVRGYRPLLSEDSDCRNKLLGALHFLINLCIRMRIDRLDGVGELAWAGAHCLPGVVRGFRQAWESRRKNSTLPRAEEIFSLFRALSVEERMAFAEAVALDGMIEADESEFLLARLPACMVELANTLEDCRF